MLVRTSLSLVLAVGSVATAQAQQQPCVSYQCVTTDPPAPSPGPAAPPYGFLAVPSPCGAGQQFASSVTILDYNGDGAADVAVGAPGQNVVFLFFGPWQTGGNPPYAGWRALTDSGPQGASCNPGSLAGFGNSLGAGNIDLDAADELFVGTPGANGHGLVHVFDAGTPGELKHVLAPNPPLTGSSFGFSFAVGDFTGSSQADLAVGAESAPIAPACATACTPAVVDRIGRVHLFPDIGLFGAGQTPPQIHLDNPAVGDPEACNGSFGHDLEAIGDLDGDQKDELFVSAVGNPNDCGGNGGQVFFYRGGAAAPTLTATVEDPRQLPCDCDTDIRFGMDMTARMVGSEPTLVVGAPRKNLWRMVSQVPDCSPLQDTGGAFRFNPSPSIACWPGFQMFNDAPKPDDLFGYKALLVDVVGSSTPDYVFTTHGNFANPSIPMAKAWDGDNLSAGPVTFLPPAGASANWALGIDFGELLSSGVAKEEIVFSDPEFDFGAGPDGALLVFFRM